MAKADRVTVMRRMQDVTKLILAGAEFSDIRQFASEQGWALSDRQLRRYQERVYTKLAEGSRRNRGQLLGRHLMQRRALYARAMKGNDLRTALWILKDEADLEGLYPGAQNGLLAGKDSASSPRVVSTVSLRKQLAQRLQALDQANHFRVARLDQTAPLRWYCLPDTHLPEQLLNILALQHLTEQLEAAGMFLFGAWSSVLTEGDPDPFLDLLLMVNAYLYGVGHEAWSLFCESIDVPRHVLLRENFNGALLSICDQRLLPLAPSKESLQEFLNGLPSSLSAHAPRELITPQSKLHAWRKLLRHICRD